MQEVLLYYRVKQRNPSSNLHYEKIGDAEPVCIEGEIPFELPNGWSWSRFCTAILLKSGKSYSVELEKKEGSMPYMKVADMNLPENKRRIKKTLRYIDAYASADVIPVGSVVFPKRGGAIKTNKKRLVIDFPVLADLNIMAATPVISELLPYFSRWVESIDLGKLDNGSNVPQINNKDFVPLFIPIPPLAEQRRIVEALDRYLELVDGMERDKVELDNLVIKAKAKVLDLAIRGKLVEQDPNDEPASVLLERIHAEKLAMVERGELPASAVKADTVIFRGDDNSYYERDEKGVGRIVDGAYEIPGNWEWASLESIASFSMGKTPARKDTSYWESNDIPWVSISDMVQGGLISNTAEGISNHAFASVFKKRIIPCGTLLMSFKLTIGRTSILGIDAVHNEAIIDITPIINPENIVRDYLLLTLPAFSNAGKSHEAIKGRTLNKDSLSTLLIALPPLKEQVKIIELAQRYYEILDRILTT